MGSGAGYGTKLTQRARVVLSILNPNDDEKNNGNRQIKCKTLLPIKYLHRRE